MKFLENTIPSTECTETHPGCTHNPAKQLIRSNIKEKIILRSEFARDAKDEVYMIMSEVETPHYLSLSSKEIETAIYWVGLVSGVKLDADDICNIVDELNHYIYLEGGEAIFIDDVIKSSEVPW